MSERLSPEAFDEFVAAHGWVYQTHRFGRVLERGLGQHVVRLQVGAPGRPTGVASVAVLKSPWFGRFGVSLPVSDHSGIVTADADATAALLAEIEALRARHGLRHVELRHLTLPEGLGGLATSDHKLTMQLALPETADALWEQLKAKVRNLIRKGEKEGLTYRAGGAELLSAFYPVYARNLRDLGTPCYPRSLFDAWFAEFPGAARIHLAELPAAGVVAGGFTFAHADRQQIPFAASLREHRSISPNMFLYWEMLKASIDAGLRCFDFGRSTRDAGTHRFKKQWGAQERPLPWSYVLAEGGEVPQLRVDSPRLQLAISCWQRLPVGLATWLGSRIVRQLP